MESYQLDHMLGGWFIGDFEPSVFRTKQFEVGIKKFPKGEKHAPHYHKIADEVTVIISGKVQIEGHIYPEGSIVLQHKNETSDFEVLEDTVIAVVKYPSSPGDKYDA